ncbi:MAG: outer membrane beta-barrel family protein, partial [Chitinophagaceae bacterium]
LQQMEWRKDDALSAVYRLKEDYTAAYASFNITLSKTTEAKAGLRYEHTNSNLGTVVVKNIVNRHYGNFFPSVFITHKLTEISTIDFSYSRRITRPTFNALAPFTYYVNANLVVTGNPTLQPSVSDNLKAGFTFKKYLFSLSYSFDDKAISGFQPASDSITNKVIVTPQNLVNQKTVSLIFSLPFTITPWWNMQYNVTAIWQRVNALYKGTPVSLAKANFNANAVQRFTLPKNFSAELSGFYQSAMLAGLGRTKPTGSLDVGLKKKLPGKGGALLFNATNILNTSYFSANINLPEQNLVGGITFLYAFPTFKLTYTRSFGKEGLKEKRERKTGAEDEKNRVQ